MWTRRACLALSWYLVSTVVGGVLNVLTTWVWAMVVCFLLKCIVRCRWLAGRWLSLAVTCSMLLGLTAMFCRLCRCGLFVLTALRVIVRQCCVVERLVNRVVSARRVRLAPVIISSFEALPLT